jgi:PAS domain S-box-containing protein
LLILLLAVIAPPVVYGGWEVLTLQIIPAHLGEPAQLLLNLAQGLLTVLTFLSFLTWYLVRRSSAMFEKEDARSAQYGVLDRQERLRQHLHWFVTMRWLAAGIALALAFVAVVLTEILPRETLLPLLGWCGALIIANIVFDRWRRKGLHLERQIVAQATVDLVILTGLLNGSGGVENPLYIVYLFHVIIPGILLPRKKAIGLTAVACGLFSLLALGEYFQLLPHYTNTLFPHEGALQSAGTHSRDSIASADIVPGSDHVDHASLHPVFVAGRTVPFVIVLALTSYFTILVAERLRRSERDLEEVAQTAVLEHKKLQGVIHAAGVGIMLVAPDVTIRWFSHRAGDWFGWTTGVLGRRCPLDGASGGCGECIVSRTAEVEQPLESERTVVSEGGALRHFRHATSPIRDDNGRVVQVVELVEEITTRKALEAKATHAGKLSVLGRMAAGIAHEIGNPLSSLSTRLTLMEQRNDPDFSRNSLGVLQGQIDRIGRIVRGVSQFSRTGSPAWSICDPNTIMEEALGIIQLDRRAKRIEICRHLTNPIPKIRGVKDQISQVFLNLLLNAMESMPNGGVLTVTSVEQDGMVKMAVTDTGSGMDGTTLAHLFEPFFTTKKEGTGLGLSISYSLVQAHGGYIEARSRPGQGSHLEVFLPLAEVERSTVAIRRPTGS